MKRISRLLLILIVFLSGFGSEPVFSQLQTISWEEAGKYVGQEVIVEGTIVRTFNSGRACFLNFHPDYERYLSLVILASDFNKFPPEPEKYYLNKNVKVRGRVMLYRNRLEIVLNYPTQITITGESSGQPGPGAESAPAKARGGVSRSDLASVKEISWEEAGNYYGQTVWVRGTVVAANNTGKVCFLNFHRNWRRYFTAVIFASDFHRFPQPPEKLYLNREVRVYGRIREYQGKPEIIVDRPEQIEIIH
ncbi:MAG: hypothetical protein ACUVRL_04040 [Candidatus Saccharicenans sp.]|uniref:hypothetical protein n=1 Tax=Candidatus Saccharicenans sp. TaxID=2819258 RepID=UPI0040496421